MKKLAIKRNSILVNFDDIIKMPGLFILKAIAKYYKKEFYQYLDIDFINSIPDKDLEFIYISRNIEHPFKWLQKSDFNIEENYKYFYNKYKDMYLSLNPLPFIDFTNTIMNNYQIENIFIYSKDYDERKAYEITRFFKDNDKERKINYVTGNFENVIKKVSPKMVFYPYIKDIYDLARDNREIIFAIPEYGFNLNDDGDLILQKEDDINIGSYPIYKNKNHYFG